MTRRNLHRWIASSAHRLGAALVATCTVASIGLPSIAAASVSEAHELRIEADVPDSFLNFGGDVELSTDGSIVVVGASDNSQYGRNTSAVYVFEADGDGGYDQRVRLRASNASTTHGEYFGSAIAASANAEVIVVGALDTDHAGEGSGSAYVFRREPSGDWQQVAELVAEGATAGDLFGESVAVSGDGGRVFVGARDRGAGTVFVFEADESGAFTQTAALSPNDLVPGDGFGFSLAAAADGNRLAVGASNQADSAGAVYVFERDQTGSWVSTAKLSANDARRGENFGWNLDLSADGSTLAIGASDQIGIWGSAGAVHLFAEDASGYVEVAKLGFGEPRYDQFGSTIALSANGSILLVGARNHDALYRDAGAAFRYERNADGQYLVEPVILAGDGAPGDRFGAGGDLSEDGSTIALGSPAFDTSRAAPNSGAVYLYGPFAHPPAPIDPPAPEPAPRPADDQIVRLYAAVFGRAPDEQGFAYWTGQYRSGVPLGTIAEIFASSDEFRASYGPDTSNEELVRIMYRNVLDRDGDAEGVSFWVDRLRWGTPLSEMLLAFSESPENIARTNTSPPLSSAEAKLLRLYRAVFGRAPDVEGFSFWLGQHHSGRPMSEIAALFASSPEFSAQYGRNPTDEAIVDALYRNVLGRPGDAGGIDYWLGRRRSGMTVVDLLLSFADSPENLQRTGTQP